MDVVVVFYVVNEQPAVNQSSGILTGKPFE